jgi:hypothetical protein
MPQGANIHHRLVGEPQLRMRIGGQMVLSDYVLFVFALRERKNEKNK